LTINTVARLTDALSIEGWLCRGNEHGSYFRFAAKNGVPPEPKLGGDWCKVPFDMAEDFFMLNPYSLLPNPTGKHGLFVAGLIPHRLRRGSLFLAIVDNAVRA